MNVVFATDRNYIQHLSVAILSLFDNNPDICFKIYIINSDISLSDWKKLVSIDLQCKHMFINAQINDNLFEDLITNFHFTKANYYRLFIDEVVTDEKALYIDSDVVVNGDLKELWNTDVSNFYLAAVEEPNFTRHKDLEMDFNSKYFNSGVMLINLIKWRNDSIRKKVLEFIRRKPSSIIYVDQCGLNAIINGNWLCVSPKFNMQTAILEMEEHVIKKLYDFDSFEDALKTPTIIHFTGSLKPWHLLSQHQFKKKYWEYLQRTSYKRLLPNDVTVKKLIIWCFPIKYRTIPSKILGAIHCFLNGIKINDK